MNLAAIRDRLAGTPLSGFRTTSRGRCEAKAGKAQVGKAPNDKIGMTMIGNIDGAKVGKELPSPVVG